MARVTVEDCLHAVDNRFELVLLAARRARQIERGAETYVDMGLEKPTVVALREIAEDKVDRSRIEEVEAAQAVLRSRISESEVQAELAQFAEEDEPPRRRAAPSVEA